MLPQTGENADALRHRRYCALHARLDGRSRNRGAQIGRGSIVRGLHKSDIEAVQPPIREMLDNDEVGAIRPWTSPSGNRGEIRLVRGGTLAGMDTARVRITVIANERRTKTFVFRYKRDAEGAWRTVG